MAACSFSGERRPPLAPLRFRAVNRSGQPGHVAGLQRHHLLPRELLIRPGFAALIAELGVARIGFDDFRRNGLLLPGTEDAACRMGLPLHRGPHRIYNALVSERVGAVEAAWAVRRRRHPRSAHAEALFRLELLQRALRRRLLLERRRPLALNRQDPLLRDALFTDLDAMVDRLWAATGAP